MRPQLLCLMVALAACGPGATGEVRAPVTNQPADEARRVRPRLTLDDALAMMPEDTEMVFELDVERLRGSVLWERIEPWLRQQGGEVLLEAARQCDFDPVATIDTILMGVRGLGGSLEMTVFVRGFPEKSTTACLERASAAARARGEEKSVRVRGDRVALLEGSDVTLVFQFVDARTVMLASYAAQFDDESRLEAATARRIAGGLTRAAPFHAVLGRVDTSATAWFAISGTAPVLGSMPYPVRALRAELHTGSDPARALIGALVIELGDANNATSMGQMLRMAIDTLKGGPYDDISQGLTVTEEGGDVAVEVRLDIAQLERIFGLFGLLIP